MRNTGVYPRRRPPHVIRHWSGRDGPYDRPHPGDDQYRVCDCGIGGIKVFDVWVRLSGLGRCGELAVSFSLDVKRGKGVDEAFHVGFCGTGRIGEIGRGTGLDREPETITLGPRLSRRTGKLRLAIQTPRTACLFRNYRCSSVS